MAGYRDVRVCWHIHVRRCGQDVDLDTGSVLPAIEATVPLSVAMAEQIKRLRQWAVNRARRASAEVPPGKERKLAA